MGGEPDKERPDKDRLERGRGDPAPTSLILIVWLPLLAEGEGWGEVLQGLSIQFLSEKQPGTGMTNGIMEFTSYAVYDLKYIAASDINYNPALGTGQIQIRDIHYVELVNRTTWEFCQMLDTKFMRSRARGEAGWLLMARKYGWVKEDEQA